MEKVTTIKIFDSILVPGDHLLASMGCAQSNHLECPKCGCTIENGRDFLIHLERDHELTQRTKQHESAQINLSCPKCNGAGFQNVKKLISHVETKHAGPNNQISCPKCQLEGFKDGATLLDHCERLHNYMVRKTITVGSADSSVMPQIEVIKTTRSHGNVKPNEIINSKSLPRVGDKVLAMWVHTKWQYFHATIRKFMADELKYEIDWDDQDTTGRFVDYFNLALDKSPDPKEISIGSIVLFQQGSYAGSQGGGTAGVRWHQGRVTRIFTNHDGTKLVDGCHTKGVNDGKWITYRRYSYTFEGVPLKDLRIGPNVFDILNDDITDAMGGTSEEDIDIYFSYSVSDSPQAIRNREIAEAPKNYLPVLDKLCDPRDIIECLRQKGLKVGFRTAADGEELRRTALLMKRARVFVACISDEYVADNECRMEFQYAKTTLGTPVVPLVVGDGSFEWTMSVVGMLIAGELYIHFRDKSVEEMKFNELLNALKSHFEKIANVTDSGAAGLEVKGEADIFLSYCWTNSFIAKEAKQIESFIGNQYADPRCVKNELEKAGFTVWLDIERLRSANASAGMYEQLTNALKDAKVVVPCVSTEYANSPNCRMEFQFAMKSLNKPIIPLIVGEGDDWRTSVIGALVASNNKQPIDLQDVNSQHLMQDRLANLFEELKNVMNIKTSPSTQRGIKYRAPKIGDHVVSHHHGCAYYMATVAAFDSNTLEYTVDWDDGDPSGKVQPYDQVALDVVPDLDDVAVGSVVFFPQGIYRGTEGNNAGGERYHEGIVTSYQTSNGTKLICGHHTKGEQDGKWVTYKGYSYNFEDCPLMKIRVAPSAMDALMVANS